MKNKSTLVIGALALSFALVASSGAQAADIQLKCDTGETHRNGAQDDVGLTAPLQVAQGPTYTQDMKAPNHPYLFTIGDNGGTIRFQTADGSLTLKYTASRIMVANVSYESSEMGASNAAKTLNILTGSDTDISAKLSVTEGKTAAFVYCSPVR